VPEVSLAPSNLLAKLWSPTCWLGSASVVRVRGAAPACSAGVVCLPGSPGPGGVDDLARAIGRGCFLRPGGAGLRRPQIEIRRNGQRGSRLDRKFVGADPVHADGLPELAASGQYKG
jgi:hypothetical protein